MFRKIITTLAFSAIAAVVMVTLSVPAPASATEPSDYVLPPGWVPECVAAILGLPCDITISDLTGETTPAVELDVTGGVVSDAVIETVMQLPESVVDALSEPLVEIPSDVDLEEALASPTDDGGDDEGTDEVLPDAVPETEIAADPAPETTDDAAPGAEAEPVSVPEAQHVAVSVSDPGTATAANGEETVAAITLTADPDSSAGLDPMMAALFGGLGVLALVMIMLAAFSRGRRSS